MKKAIILVLILNSIIVIGIPEGHGGGIMILFEMIIIPELVENGIDILKMNILEVVILISLIGKLILISTLIFKEIFKIKILIKFGLALLLFSFLSLSHKAWKYDNFLFTITFGSGIPFLIYCVRTLYFLNKENKKSKLLTE